MKLLRRTWSDLSMHRTTSTSIPSASGNMVTVLLRTRRWEGEHRHLTVGSPLMETDGDGSALEHLLQIANPGGHGRAEEQIMALPSPPRALAPPQLAWAVLGGGRPAGQVVGCVD